MVITEAGDYRNEISLLYMEIDFLKNVGEDKYREFRELSKQDYIFSRVKVLRTFEERYSIFELKEIMSVTPKENLKKANSLVEKINSELLRKSEDTLKFKSLMNDLCVVLDGRELK